MGTVSMSKVGATYIFSPRGLYPVNFLDSRTDLKISLRAPKANTGTKESDRSFKIRPSTLNSLKLVNLTFILLTI
jgi:hypothetical protein